jgi:hypothetical protein
LKIGFDSSAAAISVFKKINKNIFCVCMEKTEREKGGIMALWEECVNS